MDIYVLGAIWLVCAILGAVLASARKTSPIAGFALGLILGPLGVILVLVQKPSEPVIFDKKP